MHYAAIILLLTLVVLMLAGVVISYVRKENARNARQVRRIMEDQPDWGTPPSRKL